jgi:hypothetical protein
MMLAFAGVELIKGPIAAEISRIVDKDVDARRLTDKRSKSPFDLIRFRDIDAQGLRAVEFNRMDIPNPDFSPGSYKLGCDRPTYSPAPPVTIAVWAEKSNFGSMVIQSLISKRM